MIMTTHMKICAAGETVLGGKFMCLNAYFRKESRPQINNQSFLFKRLGKEEEIK